ncbi:MAG: glycine--tRNA ligase [Candidatus Diapherotrites archaeon]|nr:glycine--tRNA ligase [Candidatus Diapherotrites archaeon]
MPKEEIINLALRRNLFFPAAEIYSSALAGFWDFGPIGTRMRQKVISFWRKNLVEKEGFLEIDGAQILPEAVFKASGHLTSFNDPVVQCKKCHSIHRADKLIEEVTGKEVPESMALNKFNEFIAKNKVKCPKDEGELGEVKSFNMMMKTEIGATGNNPGYLRPETCQSIFLDFLRLYKTSRVNLPLGISQEGKSFRNEISPRNTLLRAREFNQMETEIFFNPKKINEFDKFDEVKKYELNLFLLKDKKVHSVSCEKAVKEKIVSGKLIAYYLARTQQLYEAYGIKKSEMRFRELKEEARAFYSKETWDFEVNTDLGWIELIACNYRTDYDLKAHGTESKKSMIVKEESGEEFIPHVFELSIGVDRTFYVVLDHAFRKEKRGEEERIYLDLHPLLAPYFVAVFPLMKKDGLQEKAEEIVSVLRSNGFEVLFDEKGSIGKRYARVDEIGLPYCLTIDYDSIEKNDVTLRERNSMKQIRIPIKELPLKLWNLFNEKESI